MSAKLIEIYTRRAVGEVESLVPEEAQLGAWSAKTEEGISAVRLLIREEATEHVMDALTRTFGADEGFRLLVLDVPATLPRPPEPEPEPEPEREGEEAPTSKGRSLTREEIRSSIVSEIAAPWRYASLVSLATVTAAIGLLRDDPAVLIGAMVIAPLLGPNIALSLATSLGDRELGLLAVRRVGLGLPLAIGIATAIGLLFPVSLESAELLRRTHLGVTDVLVGLAAGTAGALATTSRLSSALVGVMVAVALLPPLTAAGILLGDGRGDLALRAGVLAAANVACVNLAGLAVFAVQGLAPIWIWDSERARLWVRVAIGLWILVLAGIVAWILLAPVHDIL